MKFARTVNKVRSRCFAVAAAHRKSTDGMGKILYVLPLFGNSKQNLYGPITVPYGSKWLRIPDF